MPVLLVWDISRADPDGRWRICTFTRTWCYTKKRRTSPGGFSLRISQVTVRRFEQVQDRASCGLITGTQC